MLKNKKEKEKKKEKKKEEEKNLDNIPGSKTKNKIRAGLPLFCTLIYLSRATSRSGLTFDPSMIKIKIDLHTHC